MRLEQVRGTFFQTRGGKTLSANAGGSFMNHPKEFAEGLSIGIIMDGNGRWAKQRGLPRTAGHKKGAAVFQDIANYCEELGFRRCISTRSRRKTGSARWKKSAPS